MAITGTLADEIRINDQKAVLKINGHLIQAKSFNNVTSESSDRKQCQDKYPTDCPDIIWACTDSEWKNWMQNNCKKTCGYCPGEGTQVHKYIIKFLFSTRSLLYYI